MQKHEREAVAAVTAILQPAGFSVTTVGGSRAKMIIWAEGHGIRERKTMASSPKDSKHEVDHCRQWAKRLVKRIPA